MRLCTLFVAAILFIGSAASAQTVIFQDDFETKDLSAWDGITAGSPLSNHGATIVTSPVHSGQYAMVSTLPQTGGYADVSTAIPSQSTAVYYLFYFYVDPAFTQTNGNAFLIASISGGEEVGLVNSGGHTFLGGYYNGTGTTVVTYGAWHSLQIYSHVGAGTGTATIWLDGNVELTGSSYTIAGPFTSVYLGGNNGNGAQTGSIYFDDAYVATGSQIAIPAANITVRYPNTNARTAIPVDVVMWGQTSTDILIASVDSTPVYTKTGSMTAHQTFTVPLTSLTAASHTFQVQLQNSSGTPKSTYSGSFTVYKAGTPTVYIDGNNNVYKSGSPYFPVAPFLDGATEWSTVWLANSAVNTYGWEDCFINAYAYTYTTFANCMNTVAVPSIGPTNNWTGKSGADGAAGYAPNQTGAATVVAGYVTNDKSNSNLLMWSWADEPDVGPGAGNVPPSTMLAMAEATWANDGNHPVSSGIAGYPGNLTRDRVNGWYYPLVPNSSPLPFDVYSSDMYPFLYMYGDPTLTVTNLVADWDWEQNYTYHLVPIYQAIEAGICISGGSCTGYGPTAPEVTMEAWLAVIHGAKGISWWGPSGWTDQDSAHWTALANFVSQSTTLTPYILSSTPLTVTSNRTTLGTRVDASAGKVGSTTTVFAARLTDEDQATITNVSATSSLATYTASNYYTVGEVVAANGLTTSVLNCTASASCVVASLIGGSAPYTGFTIAGTYTPVGSTSDSGFAVGNDPGNQTGLSTTLSVSGSSYSGTVTVLNESRTVSASGGSFTDTFNPYAVHLYQFTDSGVTVGSQITPGTKLTPGTVIR